MKRHQSLEQRSREVPERIVDSVPLGRALEKARSRLGYSLEAAASTLGISERLLGHLEAGLRTPTEGLLEVLCERLGLDPERLGTRAYVPRVAPYLNESGNILWLGWLPIHLPEGFGNEHLVRSVGSTLRLMRSLDPSQPVYLRASDLPLLVSLLDIEDPTLPTLLIRYLGLTLSEAVWEITRMQEILTADDVPLLSRSSLDPLSRPHSLSLTEEQPTSARLRVAMEPGVDLDMSASV